MPGSTWSCFGVGHSAMEILYAAVALGGHIRVGMEDNVMYAKGVLADSNAQFVERAARVIREYGNDVATPAEAAGDPWSERLMRFVYVLGSFIFLL